MSLVVVVGGGGVVIAAATAAVVVATRTKSFKIARLFNNIFKRLYFFYFKLRLVWQTPQSDLSSTAKCVQIHNYDRYELGHNYTAARHELLFNWVSKYYYVSMLLLLLLSLLLQEQKVLRLLDFLFIFFKC